MTYFQEAKAHFEATHQHPINQMLHHLNIIVGLAGIVLLFYNWPLAVACFATTQVFAIGGHKFFEKNQPAFVKYPGITILVSILWSFENWLGLRQVWQALKGERGRGKGEGGKVSL